MKPVDEYLFRQKEPYQSIMLYVREVILGFDKDITEGISYGIPFYKYKKKSLCYLNVLKGTNFVDVGFMQGIKIEQEFPILKDHNKRKQVRSVQIESIETFDVVLFLAVLRRTIETMVK